MGRHLHVLVAATITVTSLCCFHHRRRWLSRRFFQVCRKLLPAPALVAGVPRYRLATGLDISRMIIGLWQVADLEREGGVGMEPSAADASLRAHVAEGFTTFDMADHYGSAETLMAGLSGKQALTKWVPKPGPAQVSEAAVDEAVRTSLSRMGTTSLDLLQFHTWSYLDGPGAWLEQLRWLSLHRGVRHLALCNFDTEHSRIALASGLPVVSNQVAPRHTPPHITPSHPIPFHPVFLTIDLYPIPNPISHLHPQPHPKPHPKPHPSSNPYRTPGFFLFARPPSFGLHD